MTYREAIQVQIAAIEKIYDNAGSLRDCATASEKETWNLMRSGLRTLSSAMRRMDDNMREDQAASTMRGNYHFDTSKL